jgi:hypothetical protein
VSHPNPYDTNWLGKGHGDPFSPDSEGKAATESRVLSIVGDLLKALSRDGKQVALRVEMDRDSWEQFRHEVKRPYRPEPKESAHVTEDGVAWLTQKRTATDG